MRFGVIGTLLRMALLEIAPNLRLHAPSAVLQTLLNHSREMISDDIPIDRVYGALVW